LEMFVHSGMSEEEAAAMAHLPQGQGLLGALIKEQKPIRAAPLAESPYAAGFPDHHPEMQSFLGVPIILEDKPVGNLYMTNKIGAAEFSEKDQWLAEMLATHAAVAINKAYLHILEEQKTDRLEKHTNHLTALHHAARSISQNLELDKVLQQIVDETRQLVNARYAAVGVTNEFGRIDTFVYSGMSEEVANRMPHTPRGLGLLGAIIHEQRSIRVPRISAHEQSSGFPPGHPPMESFLGVPIWSANEVVGNLYLTDKLDALEFSEQDQELAEMLATHAAVAIQNARLYEQVERLAIIEERTRIGMDLHDGVIQSIYAVGLTLESARMAMHDPNADIDPLLEVVGEGLNNAIRDIRNYILDLRPRRFSGDLGEGIRQLVREFQANTMTPVTLHLSSGLDRLPAKISRTLFLTTQEALANVARHAKASRVDVEVAWTEGRIALTITDNGRGFSLRDKTRRIGHGLANMPTRAKKLGGVFTIASALGEGTSLTMELPIHS
ncbi:MAG: GAF domain-containing protein, partial [Anaerolineales bacterium]|nr:GAF domain-containing protein [Anaerolineales bacterium]